MGYAENEQLSVLLAEIKAAKRRKAEEMKNEKANAKNAKAETKKEPLAPKEEPAQDVREASEPDGPSPLDIIQRVEQAREEQQEPEQQEEEVAAVAKEAPVVEEVPDEEPSPIVPDEPPVQEPLARAEEDEEEAEPKNTEVSVKASEQKLQIIGFTPMATDRNREYAPAVRITQAYGANAFLSAVYRPQTRTGAYCVIVDMGEKVYMQSLSGHTDDEYEYAFAGAIAALQTLMQHEIKEGTVYVQEPLCTILQQNSYGLTSGYSETRSKYVAVSRQAVEKLYVGFNHNLVDSDYQRLAKSFAETLAGEE